MLPTYLLSPYITAKVHLTSPPRKHFQPYITMASTTPFLSAIAARRSIYTLTNNSPIPQSLITSLVNESLRYCPSAFNVRSSRCITLYGAEHTALWDHAALITPKTAPASLHDLLVPRIPIFRAAYGTVLFFDDPTSVDLLPKPFQPLFDEYPEVHEHAQGMLQFAVWTALSAEGLGCNLQHYQPGITEWVRSRYGVPETWELKAQLVFGEVVEEVPEEKERTHLDVSLKVFGGEGE
jgi:predicted oxidoreductase (fatty acid repression mutant protein)